MTTKEKTEAVLRNIFPTLKNKDIDTNWGPNEIEGWDSLNHLNLVMEINKEFKVNLEFDDVMSIEKIEDIFLILKKHGIN